MNLAKEGWPIPDRGAYEQIWTKLIEAEMNGFASDFSPGSKIATAVKMDFQIIPMAKELIWSRYCYYNRKCKALYMGEPKDGVILLDRHKAAACYMAAIVSSQPMIIRDPSSNGVSTYPINEYLAITSGLSLLTSYIRSERNDPEFLPNGILCPTAGHGEYYTNFADELRFAFLDGTVNVLSIAHELFLLEELTFSELGLKPLHSNEQ